MTTTTGWPHDLALDAGLILEDMGRIRDALNEYGDLRGAEVTTVLMDQWRERVKALERGTCSLCGGLKVKCKDEARCTCAPQKKGK